DVGRTRRVAVIGDAMLDVYLRGDVERISPEAPVPVVRVRERRFALGGAANVAQNVSAAGACIELVGAVGTDDPGLRLRAMLAQLDRSQAALVDVDRPTTTKTRLLARGQQVVRFDEENDSDLEPDEVERVVAAAFDAIDRAEALVFEDYNKGVIVPPLIESAI